MNDFGKIHAAGLQSVVAEQGASCPQFTWPLNGTIYQALPGGAKRQRDLNPGGFLQDAALVIVANIAQFALTTTQLRAQFPQSLLAYDGQNYRVMKVDIFPGGQTLRIECEDVAQRSR